MSIIRIISFYTLVLFSISCSQSTEKYAAKENGKRFGIWELHYDSNDDRTIYWPSVRMVEPIIEEVKELNVYHDWDGSVYKVDSTMRTIQLRAYIKSFKSKNDAHHYNSIRFEVDGIDAIQHGFIFNEMQADSVSFYTSNLSYYIKEDISERIIKLLSGHKQVNISYASFAYGSLIMDSPNQYRTTKLEIPGSPALRKALAVLEERQVLAEKEQTGRK